MLIGPLEGVSWGPDGEWTLRSLGFSHGEQPVRQAWEEQPTAGAKEDEELQKQGGLLQEGATLGLRLPSCAPKLLESFPNHLCLAGESGLLLG